MIQLSIVCEKCNKEFIVETTQKELEVYQQGNTVIQKCFPNLNADQRELIKSHICGECFDKLFNDSCEPDFEPEDIGCECTENGIESEWYWNVDQCVYVCAGCGKVQ